MMKRIHHNHSLLKQKKKEWYHDEVIDIDQETVVESEEELEIYHNPNDQHI